MEHFLGPLCAFGSSVTWAVASVRYAQASRVLGGASVNMLRASIATLIFGVAALVFSKGLPWEGVSTTQLLWLAISVVGSYALGDSIFLAATARAGLSTALSIACTYPLWAALGAAVWGGEPFGLSQGVGTLVAIAGVVWLVQLQRPAAIETRAQSGRALGVMLALVTSLFWAINSLGVKRGTSGLPLVSASALRYGMALLLLLPQPWMVKRFGTAGAAFSPEERRHTLLRLAPVATLEVVLGSILYVYGLSHSALAVGATLSALAPLVSLPLAILFGEESWSFPRAFAVATTTVGVAILVLG